MENHNENDNYRNEIYSKSVRAGKRTYFFDVKSTRGGDHYLTLTESKKKFDQEGNFHFEKHKIFLYKEDFEKFSDGLNDVLSKIAELNEGSVIEENQSPSETNSSDSSIENIEFEDLD
ncbi:MAG: DUF3276 family protein [Flavobacteriales bacterium]|nr:DUF3276 family protein [Flavobacteriales bacterium]